MAVRLIIDGSFTDDIHYFQTFPIEPTIEPVGFLDIRLPIEQADRLTPITLLSLLQRMNTVPSDEKRLLISCHGNQEGLAMSLAPGSSQRADRFNLHTIFMLAIARIRVNRNPSAAEWPRILREMTYLDGTPMFPPFPDNDKTAERFKAVFNWFLAQLGGDIDASFPGANDVQKLIPPASSQGAAALFTLSFKNETTKDPVKSSAEAKDVQKALESLTTIRPNNVSVTGPKGGPWFCTFINALGGKTQPVIQVGGGKTEQQSRLDPNSFGKIVPLTNRPKDLNDLISLRNQVFGRFDRLDFRGCSIAKADGKLKTLHKMVQFFGVRQVCAPDVVSFSIDMAVVVDRAFNKDFNNQIEIVTNRSLRPAGPKGGARQAVKLDSSDPDHKRTVPVPRGDIPPSRRFDTDKARPGDELFIRLWVTRILPHRFTGWLRAVAKAHVEQFIKDKISPDISRWKHHTRLPLVGLWLVDDFNVPLTASPTITPGPTSGDPLEGLGLGAPPPAPLPTFALARDPEYIKHLVVGV
jgi:hypothetical protein